MLACIAAVGLFAPTIEIIETDFSRYVTAVSPDGKIILADSRYRMAPQQGAMDRPVQIQEREWRSRTGLPKGAQLVALSNAGVIFGNVHIAPQVHNRMGLRAFLSTSAGYEFLDSAPGVPVRCTGITPEGEPLGSIPRVEREVSIFEMYDLAMLQSRGWGPVGRGSLLAELYGRNRLGFVGQFDYIVLHKVTARDQLTAGTAAAAILRESSFLQMAVLKGCTASYVTAWNEGGTSIAGELHFGRSITPVIWHEGVIVDRLTIKGQRLLPRMTGITSDGSVAVGHLGSDKPAGALVWLEGKGLADLSTVLAEKKIDVPEGWKLVDAFYIDNDGSLIIGTAKNDKGKLAPFRVKLSPLASNGKK